MLKSNLAKATIGQILLISVNGVISFLFTPYLLSKIGSEAYGFYPLSFNIINYASIITIIFTSMLSKYISVDYVEKNFNRVNEFFNSSLYGNYLVGLILGIPLLVFSLFIDKIIDVPSYLALEVKILFFFITLAFLTIQIRNTYMVANISTDKRYLTTFQRSIEKIIIVSIPIVLFVFIRPSVAYLGVAVFVAAVSRLFITIKTQRKIMPQIEVDKKYVKKAVAMTLIAAGGWHCFNQLNATLVNNIDILLANVLFGATAQTEYSLASVLPNLIRSMIIYITNFMLPLLAYLFTGDKREEISKDIVLYVKYMSLFMAIIVTLLIGYGDTFLTLWIPNFYNDKIYILMVISALSIMVSGSFSSIYNMLVLYNHVKIPAIVMMVFGVLNIPLSVFLSRRLGFGMYGILISSLILNTVVYLVFMPFYLSKKLKISRKTLYPPFLKSLYLLVIGIFICLVTKMLFHLDSFSKLFLALLVTIILILIIVYIWFISKQDIKFIIEIIKTKNEYGNDVNELQSSNDDSIF